MQIFPTAYKIANDQMSKQPVYVFRIVWAGGLAGAAGSNDIYFATCDVNDILNFPYPSRWFPFLDGDSISGISQSVDPINGVSTIGQLSASIVDHENLVSQIIKAADDAGHGLRRQRCEVFLLYKGMDWADKVRIRSMPVQDLRLANFNEYKLTAADIQSWLKRTIFSPAKTKLAADVTVTTGVTLTVDSTYKFNIATSIRYGSKGFCKIGDELMYFTSLTPTTLVVPTAGRGIGGTTATTHSIGDAVDEIIFIDGNPINIALKILQSSGVAAANGAYDVYPAAWGCNMDGDAVDVSGWQQAGTLLTGLDTADATKGLRFEFFLDKGVEAKKFIEDEILKIIGAYGFVRGDGKYSVRAYSDLANASKDNAAAVLNTTNVVKWGDLTYNYTDLVNQLRIDYYEWPRLSGTYVRSALFIDSASIKKWGSAKQLNFTAHGLVYEAVYVNQLYQRFQRVMARYSRPPMQIPLTLLPKMDDLEIGDIVRVNLPIRDLFTGLDLDRAFEIKSVALAPKTGEVQVTCIAQHENGAMWYGGVSEVVSMVISPSAASIPTGTTVQLVVRCFDGVGMQVATPTAIAWVATGNVTVDANGFVTAGSVGAGSVYVTVNGIKSNTAAITVTAAPNTNPVASVSALPSVINLAAGDTQLVTASAFDVSSAQVNGVTFTWASDNTAVATVPAGPSTSAIVTAVANGSANITATETVSSVASPPAVCTVADPAPAPVDLPRYADSAYQVGAQITTLGPAGGPHTITNGYYFAPGDYWFDGDLNFPAGTTCYMFGTVRIFCLGTVTISGTIDGTGRASSYQTTGGSGGLGNKGQDAFFGIGGKGGRTVRDGSDLRAGDGGNPLNSTVPLITITGAQLSGGSYTQIDGLPTALIGGSSGCGVAYDPGAIPLDYTQATQGGAGLLIAARGIFLLDGQVDLCGASSASGWPAPYVGDRRYAHKGGGGGGSFIALAEMTQYGPVLLPNRNIDSAKINLLGGDCVTSIEPSSINSLFVAPGNGTPGCYIGMDF